MKKYLIILLSYFLLNTKITTQSYIVGPNILQTHPKYKQFLKNRQFQQANIVAYLSIKHNNIIHPIRYSRNLFGYTEYTIEIYRYGNRIYHETIRLNCFDILKRHEVKFSKNKLEKNNKTIMEYFYDLLTLINYDIPDKEFQTIANNPIKTPTCDNIEFFENGKYKALRLNFKDFPQIKEATSYLNIIAEIINKYPIKIVKIERIFNHGIYSYIIINNHIIKLPNRNYAKNLYATLLKIEIIYMRNKDIFEQDISLFFIEFDKLSNKDIVSLIKIKEQLDIAARKKKKYGKTT